MIVKEEAKLKKVFFNNLILATGGFSENPELLRQYIPWASELTSGANPYGILQSKSNGSGIKLAQKIGAILQNMDEAIALPFLGGRISLLAGMDIYLDKSGKRFISEDAPSKELVEAMRQRKLSNFWVLSDYDCPKEDSIENKILSKNSVDAFSIEEVAKIMDVSPENLQATLDHYNESASLE